MNPIKQYQVEICIDSVDSAVGAERHGADRVELCERLDLDGLTPRQTLTQGVRNAVDLGLYVIVRPREGDFCYSESEVEQMLRDIAIAKNLGADGIVSGALMPDGSLDVETTRELIAAAAPLPFTFHRAFDVCKDPLKTFAQLDAMAIDQLLTSGQGDKAIDGLEMIEKLCARESDVQIMAGSGVYAGVIEPLWNAGVRQFHFTSHLPDAQGVNRFDDEKIAAVMDVLKGLGS